MVLDVLSTVATGIGAFVMLVSGIALVVFLCSILMDYVYRRMNAAKEFSLFVMSRRKKRKN